MLGRPGFASAEHNVGERLAGDGLGLLAVKIVELAHPLKAEDDRIVGLPLLGQRSLELRQNVQ